MFKINDLAFRYGSKSVLEHITLTLEDGKIYGLLGENGVGKTTLLTLLSGLKKPFEGSIEADGMIPFDRRPSFLENIFYLPDEVAPVAAKAGEWAKNLGEFYPNFNYEKYLELLAQFELSMEHKMNAMSAGQLKKAYISFALACGTHYIFMDEPTNGLDIPSKTQFRSAILKYTDEKSCIVISTHQVRDLENIIDPIIIMDNKGILLNASLETIASKMFSDGAEGKIDIEALFNEAHSNRDEFTKKYNE